MEIFTIDGWYLLLRWIHLLAGITWIGLLYYFNFVQGEWFKETDA
ncbi:MAG TPA: antitermination protein NusG, partial [Candidatus Lambdaproteobacteria bacterium]